MNVFFLYFFFCVPAFLADFRHVYIFCLKGRVLDYYVHVLIMITQKDSIHMNHNKFTFTFFYFKFHMQYVVLVC